MTNQVAQGQDLDDFLINLADGLSRAQSKLNNNPVVNAFGQEALVYHIPKMEFELHLKMTSATPQQQPQSRLPLLKPKLAFSPIGAADTPNSSSASSTIKGVMVATPIDGGRPQPKLTLTATAQNRNALIEVTGSNSLGEPLIDQTIELNIDRELSQKLNKNEGRPALKRGTKLQQSSLSLSEDGKAQTQLIVSSSEPSGQLIALTADLFSKTETLLYRHK